MEQIKELIKSGCNNPKTVFVFHTQAEAREWFIRSLEITGKNALPEDMFLAWDSFKIKFFTSEQTKKPITQIVRKIFVHNILKENAVATKKGNAIFKKIILQKFSDTSTNFLSWFVSILPQLDNLEKKSKDNKVLTDEIKDFFTLKKCYQDFLDRHSLYEPSWISENLKLNNEKIKIIFPELNDDFIEYKDILSKNNSIEFIHTDILEHAKLKVVEFDNSRTEIEYCISKVEELLTEGVKANDIAITLCDFNEVKPYLQREAELRGIPIEFRAGEKLGATQVGLLFTQIYDIVQNNFDFDSMKILFSNSRLPWKHKREIKTLLDFGIENNCVASWKENSIWKISWEESFKLHENEMSKEVYAIKSFFEQFKNIVTDLVKAKSFNALLKKYIEFRDKFLCKEKFFPDDDLILSRCIEKIKSLSLLENDFKNELPERFSFFIDVINETTYVYQNTGTAVSVFNYRVIAVSPFEYNFLLNANQKTAKANFSNLNFLRNDLRKKLNANDIDADEYFLKTYANNKNSFISFSKKTFSGYAICHNALEKNEMDKNKKLSTNSFVLEEKNFYNFDFEKNNFIPYQLQKKGLQNFLENFKIKNVNNFSFLKNSFNKNEKDLREKIFAKLKNFYKENKFAISSTQLDKFNACPTFYFLETILEVEQKYNHPIIFTPLRAGLLSHSIIEKILTFISNEDKVFNAQNIQKYLRAAKKIIEEEVKNFALLNSSFSKPFTNIILQKKFDEIEALLNFFVENYNGFEIPIIEKEFLVSSDNYYLTGKIDAAFYNEIAGFVLLDFKSNWTPSANESRIKNADDELAFFQLAVYVHLIENNKHKNVSKAFYWSLAKKSAEEIVNEKFSRDDFDLSLQKMLDTSREFYLKVFDCDFSVGNVNSRDCNSCIFKTTCRTRFQVEGK